MATLERFRAKLDCTTGEIISLIELFDAAGQMVNPPNLLTATNAALDSDGNDFAASIALRTPCETEDSEKVVHYVCVTDDGNGPLGVPETFMIIETCVGGIIRTREWRRGSVTVAAYEVFDAIGDPDPADPRNNGTVPVAYTSGECPLPTYDTVCFG